MLAHAVDALLVQEAGHVSDPHTKRRRTGDGGLREAFPSVESPPALTDSSPHTASASDSGDFSRAASAAGFGGDGAGGGHRQAGAARTFQEAFQGVASPLSDSSSGLAKAGAGSDSGSDTRDDGASPSGDGPPKKLDRKTKHRFVEQNRRRKKIELIDVLQDVVGVNPFAKKTSKTQSKVNMILEATLDFLQQADVARLMQQADKRVWEAPDGASPCGEDSERQLDAAHRDEASAAASAVALVVPRPRNFIGGQFGGAFDSAPCAMVMSTPQGNVLRCNRLAYNLFGVEAAETPTIFNVTAPVSLPDTLKAISQLLSGQARKIKMLKRCGVKSGATPQFQTEMNCIHKRGKPQFFVCYLKEVPEDAPARRRIQAPAAGHAQQPRFQEISAQPRVEEDFVPTVMSEGYVQDRRTESDKMMPTYVSPTYQWNFSRFVDVPLARVKIPIVEEDIEDPEMDQIFRAIDQYAKDRDSEYARMNAMLPS